MSERSRQSGGQSSTAFVIEPEVLEPEQRTIAGLASVANREHDLANAAALTAVEHWANAGDALREVKGQLPPGEWLGWLGENFKATQNWGQFCVRLATYRDRIEAEGITSVRQAKVFLAGLPAIERGVEFDQRKTQALELRDDGYTYRAIAESLECSLSTVQKWCNPRTRERQKQQKKEWARAKSLMLSKRKAKQIGGAMAEAYAMAERMQDVLAEAQRQTEDSEAKRALSEAGIHYRHMRDEIVRALGVAV